MGATVIGVDGGGSKTRAVLLGPDGKERARTEGWAAVADARAPEGPAESVAEVCQAVAQLASVRLPVDVLWAGLAGAGREAARAAVELELSRMELANRVHVDTDVRVAFQDAFGDGPGILLLSGTGSIAWGRAEDGREGRVGGLGHHIGDEGSGYQLGMEAVRRVARHDDGRGPATSLQDHLLGFLSLERVDDLVTWSSYATRAEIAELAPLVVQAADDQDAVAEEMVATAVEELESNVLTILETLGPWSERPGLVLGGGLLRGNGPLRDRLVAVFANRHVQVMDRDPDPPMGAARLALASIRWGP